MEHPAAVVTIEQPTVNKVTVFLVAGSAIFITLVLWAKIEAGVFTILLLVFLVAVVAYTYRSSQIVAIADADGIDVRNLVRRRYVQWSDVAALSVGPAGKGQGTGIAVVAVDGTEIPVEASWGPWYQGKSAARNTVRCEKAVRRIDAMRAHDPGLDRTEGTVLVDPIVVRAMLAEDIDAAAETIDAAWRETYDEILPGQVFNDRDPGDDAAMLRDLLDGAIPGAGSLVVLRDGVIVGASVYGPTGVDGLEGFTEVYMLYVRADEIGGAASRRLVMGTLGAIRGSGVRGIVGHVYVNNRSFRNRVEKMGILPHGKPQEQIWYGLPIRVVEYRMMLSSEA